MLLELQQQTYNATEDAHYKFSYQHRLFEKPMLICKFYNFLFSKFLSYNIGYLNNQCCIY